MNRIKIMTDSACDIPKELEEQYDIRILSFPVTVGDKGYLERIDFTNEEFYEILQNAPKIPVTSQITVFQFEEEFKTFFEQGYAELIYVSIYSGGSSTYNNAVMAKEQFYESHPEAKEQFKIHLVDSKAYTMAYGYPVVEAAKKAQRGASSGEIIAYLTDWFDSVEIYFAPYTLEFVKKSGRVPVAAAFVGELIGLRPIISIIDGETKVVEKVRGDKAILPALLKRAKERVVPQTPYMLVRSTKNEECADLAAQLKKQFGYEAVGQFDIGAAISINAGPKVVGVIVKGQNRRAK